MFVYLSINLRGFNFLERCRGWLKLKILKNVGSFKIFLPTVMVSLVLEQGLFEGEIFDDTGR